jgi:tripartite-type tricarboxylate transporter receptor subunit TctC
VPFKSGGEADVQLSGGHVDGHVNNPAESVGNWKAGKVRPLCVFNPAGLAKGPKVTDTMSWADIPTCKSAGLKFDSFVQPRIASLPGKAPAAALEYWQGVFRKVAESQEWKDYIERSAQSSRPTMGADLAKFIEEDYGRFQTVFKEQGWLVQ